MTPRTPRTPLKSRRRFEGARGCFVGRKNAEVRGILIRRRSITLRSISEPAADARIPRIRTQIRRLADRYRVQGERFAGPWGPRDRAPFAVGRIRDPTRVG